MIKTPPFITPGDVKINCHDPRHHQEFLLLSNSINGWKGHVHDPSWWLKQETQCLALFGRYGYDLQSGVWFCLIGCQRHGWTGMANATLLLAEGFSKKQRQCWPPMAATDLRQQILEWYTTHAASCLYGLPLASAQTGTLTQLEGAVSLLLEHAQNLQSRSQSALRILLDYLQSSRQALQKKGLTDQTTALVERPSIDVETVVALPSSPLAPVPRPWRAWLTGGASGVVLTLCLLSGINLLKQPSTMVCLEKLWPGNPVSVSWRSQLAEQSASLPAINSWARLNNQLNALDQRLLAAEQKRKPYMTISELKTEIYQMRQTLQQGGEPVLAQLSEVQQKRENKQPVSAAEIDTIARHIDALNSRLIQLSGDNE